MNKTNDEILLRFVDALRSLTSANSKVIDVLNEFHAGQDTDEITEKAAAIFDDLYKEYQAHLLDIVTDDVFGNRRCG